MGTYLTQTFGASGVDLALAYENQSIGALIVPIVGLIADRFFADKRDLKSIWRNAGWSVLLNGLRGRM